VLRNIDVDIFEIVRACAANAKKIRGHRGPCETKRQPVIIALPVDRR
jgi:hypothetical protein